MGLLDLIVIMTSTISVVTQAFPWFREIPNKAVIEDNVTLHILDQDGLHRFRRSVQDPDMPNSLHFRFRLAEEDVHIRMKRSDVFIKNKSGKRNIPDFPVFVIEDGLIKRKQIIKHHDLGFYANESTGSSFVVRRAKSRANFIMEGIFYQGLQKLHLSPDLSGSTHRVHKQNMVVDFREDYVESSEKRYAKSSVGEKSDEKPTSVPSAVNELTAGEGERLANHSKHHTVTKRQAGEDHEVQLFMVADYRDYRTWLKYYGYNSTLTELEMNLYYAFIANSMSVRYSSVILVDPSFSLDIIISGLLIVNSQSVSYWTEDFTLRPGSHYVHASSALDSFRHWVKSARFDLPHSDHWMLFTGFDIYTDRNPNVAGLAKLGGMCSLSSVSIIEQDNTGSVGATAAHELGHSDLTNVRSHQQVKFVQVVSLGDRQDWIILGALHDGEEKSCYDEDNYIMSRKLKTPDDELLASRPWQFSPCSVQAFKRFVSQTKCTHRSSVGMSVLSTKLSPGQVFSADLQCQLALGNGSYFGRSLQIREGYPSMCRRLYCAVPGEPGLYQAIFAMEKTSCGDGKWCQQGKCVDHIEAPHMEDTCPQGDDPTAPCVREDCPYYTIRTKTVYCCTTCHNMMTSWFGLLASRVSQGHVVRQIEAAPVLTSTADPTAATTTSTPTTPKTATSTISTSTETHAAVATTSTSSSSLQMSEATVTNGADHMNPRNRPLDLSTTPMNDEAENITQSKGVTLPLSRIPPIHLASAQPATQPTNTKPSFGIQDYQTTSLTNQYEKSLSTTDLPVSHANDILTTASYLRTAHDNIAVSPQSFTQPREIDNDPITPVISPSVFITAHPVLTSSNPASTESMSDKVSELQTSSITPISKTSIRNAAIAPFTTTSSFKSRPPFTKSKSNVSPIISRNDVININERIGNLSSTIVDNKTIVTPQSAMSSSTSENTKIPTGGISTDVVSYIESTTETYIKTDSSVPQGAPFSTQNLTESSSHTNTTYVNQSNEQVKHAAKMANNNDTYQILQEQEYGGDPVSATTAPSLSSHLLSLLKSVLRSSSTPQPSVSSSSSYSSSTSLSLSSSSPSTTTAATTTSSSSLSFSTPSLSPSFLSSAASQDLTSPLLSPSSSAQHRYDLTLTPKTSEINSPFPAKKEQKNMSKLPHVTSQSTPPSTNYTTANYSGYQNQSHFDSLIRGKPENNDTRSPEKSATRLPTENQGNSHQVMVDSTVSSIASGTTTSAIVESFQQVIIDSVSRVNKSMTNTTIKVERNSFGKENMITSENPYQQPALALVPDQSMRSSNSVADNDTLIVKTSDHQIQNGSTSNTTQSSDKNSDAFNSNKTDHFKSESANIEETAKLAGEHKEVIIKNLSSFRDLETTSISLPNTFLTDMKDRNQTVENKVNGNTISEEESRQSIVVPSLITQISTSSPVTDTTSLSTATATSSGASALSKAPAIGTKRTASYIRDTILSPTLRSNLTTTSTEQPNGNTTEAVNKSPLSSTSIPYPNLYSSSSPKDSRILDANMSSQTVPQFINNNIISRMRSLRLNNGYPKTRNEKPLQLSDRYGILDPSNTPQDTQPQGNNLNILDSLSLNDLYHLGIILDYGMDPTGLQPFAETNTRNFETFGTTKQNERPLSNLLHPVSGDLQRQKPLAMLSSRSESFQSEVGLQSQRSHVQNSPNINADRVHGMKSSFSLSQIPPHVLVNGPSLQNSQQLSFNDEDVSGHNTRTNSATSGSNGHRLQLGSGIMESTEKKHPNKVPVLPDLTQLPLGPRQLFTLGVPGRHQYGVLFDTTRQRERYGLSWISPSLNAAGPIPQFARQLYGINDAVNSPHKVDPRFTRERGWSKLDNRYHGMQNRDSRNGRLIDLGRGSQSQRVDQNKEETVVDYVTRFDDVMYAGRNNLGANAGGERGTNVKETFRSLDLSSAINDSNSSRGDRRNLTQNDQNSPKTLTDTNTTPKVSEHNYTQINVTNNFSDNSNVNISQSYFDIESTASHPQAFRGSETDISTRMKTLVQQNHERAQSKMDYSSQLHHSIRRQSPSVTVTRPNCRFGCVFYREHIPPTRQTSLWTTLGRLLMPEAVHQRVDMRRQNMNAFIRQRAGVS